MTSFAETRSAAPESKGTQFSGVEMYLIDKEPNGSWLPVWAIDNDGNQGFAELHVGNILSMLEQKPEGDFSVEMRYTDAHGELSHQHNPHHCEFCVSIDVEPVPLMRMPVEIGRVMAIDLEEMFAEEYRYIYRDECGYVTASTGEYRKFVAKMEPVKRLLEGSQDRAFETGEFGGALAKEVNATILPDMVALALDYEFEDERRVEPVVVSPKTVNEVVESLVCYLQESTRLSDKMEEINIIIDENTGLAQLSWKGSHALIWGSVPGVKNILTHLLKGSTGGVENRYMVSRAVLLGVMTSVIGRLKASEQASQSDV